MLKKIFRQIDPFVKKLAFHLATADSLQDSAAGSLQDSAADWHRGRCMRIIEIRCYYPLVPVKDVRLDSE